MSAPRRLPRREFARALRLGLGRAVIDVRRHGLDGREDLLVAACLHNPTRDPQIEGGLEGWLLDIAKDGGATALVRRAVLDAASRRIANRRDRRQTASMIAMWTLDGDRAAARVLLRMIEVQPPGDSVADPAIWGLGETAWRRVIQSYGRRWDQARRFDWGWIVAAARREAGPRKMLAVLRQETDGKPRLRPLAERVEGDARRQARSKPRERVVDAGLDGLERLVRNPGRLDAYLDLPRWTERATPADRAEAWRRFLVETDVRRLRRRLLGWRGRKPPELHSRLFELVRHPDRRVRLGAVGVLRQVKDPRVRAIALRSLRAEPVRALDAGVLRLLELNAVDEDATVIDAALPPRASREVRDDWVMGVLSIIDPLRTRRGPSRFARRRRSPKWTPLLLRAMETTPCRECRGNLLELLIDRGAATEAMLNEALFDANAETRQTAREAVTAAPAPVGSRGRPSAASAGP